MYQVLQSFWWDIINHPGASIFIISNLVIIESLLSVDNAAVLATMVIDLPKDERSKALKYGIIGAYLFRGLAMVFASFLIKFWWLKPFGGLYLIYLVYGYWKGKQTETKEDDIIDKKNNWLFMSTVGFIGNFWATVALVELMDMAFSIDNIFAVVAYSTNIILVCIGVFIGILAMRFIAQWFVKLMEKYSFLETSAFVVIGILGLKLTFSFYEHFNQGSFLESSMADVIMSILTILIFFVPIITSLLFDYPKRNNSSEVSGEV